VLRLSPAEAKRAVAAFCGVPVEAVEIHVRA
jgi:hypothetical protein